eukprot:976874_1
MIMSTVLYLDANTTNAFHDRFETITIVLYHESIPTIQVGPHPHYKHKHGHGHRKQVKRPCKYYNQSGCTEISRKYSQYFKVTSLLQELTGLKEGMDSIES